MLMRARKEREEQEGEEGKEFEEKRAVEYQEIEKNEARVVTQVIHFVKE